uniref:Uncharacterized protein n=1 Tax=Anguilla anguilla TaxID=7936 RepID=A0A0E9Q0Q8_ANGAN
MYLHDLTSALNLCVFFIASYEKNSVLCVYVFTCVCVCMYAYRF